MLIPLLCTLLQAPAPPTASPAPFTLTLDGFVGKLEMVPLPGKSKSGKTLWMSKTEVTWEFYDVFAYRMDLTEEQKAQGVDAKARPSRPYGAPDRGYGHNGFAALSIQYDGAVRFCEWLSKKTSRSLRMPTESEWELACRAGAKKPFSPKEIDAMAWHEGNSDDAAQPVASRKPNAWGLYDMLGNAWEWCSPDKPGSPPAVRGGSFRDAAKLLNPMYRSLYQAEWQTADAQSPKSKWWLSDGPHIGFRIVCEE
jgi:formylglycine-generating enzyme required for sulfatase activity